MADFTPPGERRSAAGRPGGEPQPALSQPDHSDPAGDRQPNGTPSEGTWPRSHARPRQAYAAIDLGTNNCRLLIARPQDRNFVVIDAFSRVVRLGEGLAGLLESHGWQAGCPARIRTLIDGVRVRSLTVRGRGNVGSGASRKARCPRQPAAGPALARGTRFR